MIRVWHVLISGFTESWAKPTGTEELWRKLAVLESPKTAVLAPLEWDADWKAVAGFIRRNSESLLPLINVYAYSWGAGWGFVNLAKHLGINIRRAVLCDPVYRSPFMPAAIPLNPLSFFSSPTITVPRNVMDVRWLYQRRNKPAGHTPVSAVADVVEPGFLIDDGTKHSGMDNHPRYHAEALVAAARTQREAA